MMVRAFYWFNLILLYVGGEREGSDRREEREKREEREDGSCIQDIYLFISRVIFNFIILQTMEQSGYLLPFPTFILHKIFTRMNVSFCLFI
jgi:hypothetical protein